ncbi:MAG: hypothetical protein JW910_15520 [Anaerolineae bacterium]|nr:hypothetical protein [Anaerolineae bacterium]
MKYEFAPKLNYEDYAAGRVLLSRPGTVPFPVRLASEIFQRGAALLRQTGRDGPYHVYDPCCGSGYLLTVLGLLHGAQLAALTASDIDADMVALARRNLALLTPAGLDERIAQLEAFIHSYGKDSHRAALVTAQTFKEQVQARPAPRLHCFTADATQVHTDLVPPGSVDIVISDVPYGRQSQWIGAGADDRPVHKLLDGLLPLLARPGVVAIASDKRQKMRHEAYRQVTRLAVGKRQITLLQIGE